MKHLLLSIAIILFATVTIQAKEPKAQKEPFKPRISLGVNAIFEGGHEAGRNKKGGYNSTFDLIVRPGISFDVQLSKHSGIETGIYYRQNIIREHYANPMPYESVFIPEYRDNRILIPIYYKFYSRILNFSAGAEVAFNLNNNSKKSFSKIDCGITLRLSKDFKLYKGLYIEPLIQGTIGNISWWGLGVGLKYRF